MAAKLITYDLRAPGRNYDDLYEVIKNIGDWCHPLESTWIVVTLLDVNQVADQIRRVIDENDSFLVLDITRDSYQGWLSTEIWQWIRANV